MIPLPTMCNPEGVPLQHEAIELAGLTRDERYKLLTGAVIPRPIALVTTVSPNGRINAAPYSQFVIIAVDPGLLGISIGPRAGGPKDTLANIERTGEFVINMVPSDWASIVQDASIEHPPEISEVDLLHIETVPSVSVRPPRIACSPVHFECKLERIETFGSAPNAFVVGEVVLMHVTEGLANNCKIDPKTYSPLARIGGRNYVRLGDIICV